jgi:4-alpha-glucanotransferase
MLYLTGSLSELGNWSYHSAKPMLHTGNGEWILDIELPDNPIDFEYRYFLKADNQLILEEWERNHKLTVTDVKRNYVLADYWQNIPQKRAFYSSAFVRSWFAHPCRKNEKKINASRKILIKVLAPEISRNHSLSIIGNQADFGNWKPGKSLVMDCKDFPEWSAEIDANKLTFPIEYKFCILNNENKELIHWEKGENRIFPGFSPKENETIVLSGMQFHDYPSEWKCAGTVIPVFSLRSENSFGIGDFADLIPCIDWLNLTSQKILQLLPLNDTTQTHTWTDSYPYNAISIYALHPLYLNLSLMGKLNDSKRESFFRKKQKELNVLAEVDYKSVDHYKWAFFHEIFNQDGLETLRSPEFVDFFENNCEWLIPYAAYSYLRDKNQTSDFCLWKDFRKYNKDAIEKLCRRDSPQYMEIALYYFLQFHLHKQLIAAEKHAHAKGVALKGDIPIGISRTSVEAWTEPAFFNRQYQTGAPPDDFSPTGQNWGFPTYNWDEMEKSHYDWWKKRFRKMSEYFSAYRIDHILGFFRIWEIPENSVQGLLGCFSPSLPFSVEEIENAGFRFIPEKYANPHINENFLPKLFGEYTQEVSHVFLDRSSSQHFALKEKFDTQVKIRNWFSGKDDEKSEIIRQGLYSICNEVLFIRDKQKPEYFHPRISASNSYIYKELDNADKYAFDYLYRDYFYLRHNEFWREKAYGKLKSLISATDMLPCGEDLGMIPLCVPEVMQKLQILSLEIERMPKEVNVEFTRLDDLPYHSVCTTSTHDMNTVRMWWKESRKRTQRYYNDVLKREGLAPVECTTDICEQIISNHLDTCSMLVVIPLQDWLSIDKSLRRKNEDEERIHIPANPRHYWKYRMHLPLEELLKARELNERIKYLIQNTKRNIS